MTGDRYAGEWPRESASGNMALHLRTVSDRPKSDIYRDVLPILNSGKAELLDHPRAVAELCGLERRTARGGKDSIDHAPGAHDDVANSVAGAILLTAVSGRRMIRFSPKLSRASAKPTPNTSETPWRPGFDSLRPAHLQVN